MKHEGGPDDRHPEKEQSASEQHLVEWIRDKGPPDACEPRRERDHRRPRWRHDQDRPVPPGVDGDRGARPARIRALQEKANRKFHPADTAVDCGHGVKIEEAARLPSHRRTLLRRGREPPSHRPPGRPRPAPRCSEAAPTARTSPYAYQGMGPAGLDLLREAADELDMPIVTEISGSPRRPGLPRQAHRGHADRRPQRAELPPSSRKPARRTSRCCSSAACRAPSTSC